MAKSLEEICHLCGNVIDSNIPELSMEISREHVPPLQFFPKQIRGEIKGSLLVLPTHKGCNQSFQADEEYFIHTYSIHVNSNTNAQHLISDIRRRTQSKQSQRLLQMIENEFSNITQGGIVLPSGTLVHNVNAPRVDRVLRKILQGLYYYEEKEFLPYETAMWIQPYEKPEDMPYYFNKIFCETGPCRGVCKKVFAYRYTNLESYSYWSMLLWDSLLFCIIFKV
jgi:hypothetical protein